MARNSQLENRIIRHGLSDFDDVEVLDLLLRLHLNETSQIPYAEKMLNKYTSLSNIIDTIRDNPEDIPEINGDYLLGLKLPYEMANRYLFDKVKQQPIFHQPVEVVKYLNHSMRGLKKEHFRVLYLNNMNKLIAEEDISIGTVNKAPVYPREVLKSALRFNATGLIFAHNHVSGNLRPSNDDIKITEKLYSAAKALDISVYDHIIVAGNDYFSFLNQGLIQNKQSAI